MQNCNGLPDPGTGVILKGGVYIGSTRRVFELSGLKLAVMTATGATGEVEEHGHEEAHLLLIATSGYSSSADGAPPVTRGSAAIFNPRGTFHRDRFTHPGIFLSVSVDQEWIEEAASELRLPTAPNMIERAIQLRRGAELLAICLRNDPQEVCTAEMTCLEFLGGFSASKSLAAPAWLARARQLLHDESDVPRWSIRSVADVLEVSSTHLARVFRTHLGCTPGGYVHALRAQKAARLLADGRMPLTEIAWSLGYADQSHFTRWFRRTWRTTPAAFRNALS